MDYFDFFEKTVIFQNNFSGMEAVLQFDFAKNWIFRPRNRIFWHFWPKIA
jgi:hypothetical protein